MPTRVEIGISDNPDNFVTVTSIPNDVPENSENPVIKIFTGTNLHLKGRYVKVTAGNIGTCPPWHPGAGEKAWIFTDEITVE
jgi:hexosaminidase